MAKVCFISCVSEKLSHAAPAADLYQSALFQRAKQYAVSHSDRWFVLSAEHGLLRPETIIAPYEKTLNKMPVMQRREWGAEVLAALFDILSDGDELTFIAGEHYREFLVPELQAKGFRIHVPMEGLTIGKQLQWLNAHSVPYVQRFYSLLDVLADKIGGPRLLGSCRGRDGWPRRGVYFFFEPGETRSAYPSKQRVTRVGTHAITKGRTSTLWSRLRAHRGSSDGGGNHRGSIFRLHLGEAIRGREGVASPGSWGIKSSAARDVRGLEVDMERRVSAYLARMSVVWLSVDDEPKPESERAVIEANAIGMLTDPNDIIDPPSSAWLGHDSTREQIRSSGLWNVNHVRGGYSPMFLDIMERHIAAIN